MLGRIEGRRRGRQRMRLLDGITDLMDMSLSKLQGWWWTGKPGVLQPMGPQRVGHDWVNRTEREKGFSKANAEVKKQKKTLHLPKFIQVVEYINTSQVKQRMICPPVSEHAYARQWSQFSAIWQLILKFLVKHTTSTGPCTGHSLIWFPKLNFTLWLEADLWTFT